MLPMEACLQDKYPSLLGLNGCLISSEGRRWVVKANLYRYARGTKLKVK